MPLPIAIDYRPALLSRAGIGRATRELSRALSDCNDLQVHLFGHSVAPAKVPVRLPDAARLHRLPIPGRSLPLLRRLGLGADRLAGSAKVFHWTDYVQPPVCDARTILTVHDETSCFPARYGTKCQSRYRVDFAFGGHVVAVPTREVSREVGGRRRDCGTSCWRSGKFLQDSVFGLV